MKAIHLQTEYLTEPLGLGIVSPKFYWNCEGGITQTAYQIVAKRGNETVWNSGKTVSSSMTHIQYAGKKLNSRDRIKWFVRLWDENDRSGDWAESWFELGLLKPSDWTGHWIAGNYKPRKNIRWPADCFRKEFHAKKNVAKARLYITACGLYEAMLNGKRVGDFVMAPGCTDYRKRVQYQTYDVTELLQEENTLEITLADGWYRGSLGAYGQTAVYGHQTKLLCQLEVIYTDGTLETINSGADFAWSNDGPIRFNDLKDGEIYDANYAPSYSGHACLTKESIVPSAADNVLVREKEHFTPVLSISPSGKKILNFQQNIAGFIAFTVNGKKGQKIRLRMGEMLDESGELSQKNIQLKKPVKEWGTIKQTVIVMGMGEKFLHEPMQSTPLQEVTFICSGGEDYYKTRFAVFGFQYCEVDTDISVGAADFEAIAVYSDLEQTGEFTCSHALVNKLMQNIRWSMKGNFLDIPTDCPTRERLGWTGDAQVFFNAGAYLMNTAPFFRKWLKDLNEGRLKSGIAPSVVPFAGNALMYDSSGGSVGWADAMILIPYRYWKRFGDSDVLIEHYNMMADYANYLIAHTGHKDKKQAKANPYNKYVYEKGLHLGEWLEPVEFQESGFDSRKPHPEEATAYLHYSMSCLKEIAHVLGRTEDETLFAEYAEGSKKAYCWLFFRNGVPDTDRQAKLVRPLALGLAEGDETVKAALQNRLVQAVENRQYRIATGFLSTPFVLGTLTEADRTDLAYKMLENEKAPGWLYQVKHGATTIWEEWEGKTNSPNGSGSLNHYSPGAVCQWMFETAAGIQVAGENHFVIAPVPGGSLTCVSACYKSLYGEVKSSWEKTAHDVHYFISIPANTTAQVMLPNGEIHIVSAGYYEFMEMR